jgi:hypothetical protein
MKHESQLVKTQPIIIETDVTSNQIQTGKSCSGSSLILAVGVNSKVGARVLFGGFLGGTARGLTDMVHQTLSYMASRASHLGHALSVARSLGFQALANVDRVHKTSAELTPMHHQP